MCDTVTSQSHEIKGGTTDEVFQELFYCGREELLVVWFNIFYMHNNI